MPQLRGYEFPRQKCPTCGRDIAVGTPHQLSGKTGPWFVYLVRTIGLMASDANSAPHGAPREHPLVSLMGRRVVRLS